MYECSVCFGSIDASRGICMDCGHDEMEHVHDYEEWLDALPPVETYEEAA